MKPYFFLFLLLFAPFIGECQDTQTVNPSSFKFVLPINWTTTPKYSLTVTIPQGYVPLQPFNQWSEASLIEFVPSGENGNNRSEIISVNKFINQGISADDFVTNLKARMQSQAQGGNSVWSERRVKYPNYTAASLVLSYNFQGRQEVIGATYYSGPNDCVGVQYTIRVNNQLSVKYAVSKIENFFNTQTQVTTE